jgi:beta-phosphoglucomutase family hydrolase
MMRKKGTALSRMATLEAWLFDLDGVLTDTASVHDAAWKVTFDEFLSRRAGKGALFTPFDPVADYEQFVDGEPRLDGVRSFLSSRGIHLPEGGPEDGPECETVTGVGRRKNDLVLRMLAEGGVNAFPGSVALVRALREDGRRLAVVSASENCAAVLEAAGIADLFDLRVDGRLTSEQGLAGKPAPDTYLYAARELGIEPGCAAVVEDAPAGVASGRAGHFGLVVGVSRGATADELLRSGADVVVSDLAELFDRAAPMTPSAVLGPTALGGAPSDRHS